MELRNCSWDILFKDHDTQSMWISFRSKLNDLIAQFVPVKKVYRNRHCMWIDYSAHKKIKSRNRKWKRFCETGDLWTLIGINQP